MLTRAAVEYKQQGTKDESIGSSLLLNLHTRLSSDPTLGGGHRFTLIGQDIATLIDGRGVVSGGSAAAFPGLSCVAAGPRDHLVSRSYDPKLPAFIRILDARTRKKASKLY